MIYVFLTSNLGRWCSTHMFYIYLSELNNQLHLAMNIDEVRKVKKRKCLLNPENTKKENLERTKAENPENTKKENPRNTKKENPGSMEQEYVHIETSDNTKLLTTVKFKDLKKQICKPTLCAISEMQLINLTFIQERSLLPLLKGKDLTGIAKTGSGKTLAFLIPVIERLYRDEVTQEDGTCAVIITPTRELAIQINLVLEQLLTHHHLTHGLVIGGDKKKREAAMLSKGVNILVATPGRLVDHLQNTRGFIYKNTRCLVIDEVDRMLDFGFEEDMKCILRLLPNDRQTMMFSATHTEQVRLLTALALKEDPIYVGVDDNKATSTVSGLEQYYALCPVGKRLIFLHFTLKKLKKKKVMVFFSSRSSVEFHFRFFSSFHCGVNLMCIHGKMEQSARTVTYFDFCNAEVATLFCTDVAARGLDIPEVDFILQYDPPRNAQEYIHRVGRTARGEGKKGQALLVLRPEESKFLGHLKDAKIPLEEFGVPWEKISEDRQEAIESLIQGDADLKAAAKEAFTSYMRSYALHTMRDVFDIYSFCMEEVGHSFGFSEPPLVDLNLNVKKRKRHLK